MKLTNQDIVVLKNFASINQSIKFSEGSLVRTKNPAGDIHGYATLSDSVTESFCVYDLPRLIRTIELFDEAELSFTDSAIEVTGGGRSAQYAYSSEELLEGVVSDYSKNVRFPPIVSEIIITEATLTKALQASSILSLPEILIKGTEGVGVVLSVCHYDQDSSDRFDVELAGDVGGDFELVFDASSLKMIKQDYTVEVSEVGLTHWIGSAASYYVAKKDI